VRASTAAVRGSEYPLDGGECPLREATMPFNYFANFGDIKGEVTEKDTSLMDTLVFEQSSTEGSSRLFVGNLSFDQTSDADDGQLDLVVSNSSEDDGGSYILYQDVTLPAVQTDFDLA
jgi:hypothetical protein